MLSTLYILISILINDGMLSILYILIYILLQLVRWCCYNDKTGPSLYAIKFYLTLTSQKYFISVRSKHPGGSNLSWSTLLRFNTLKSWKNNRYFTAGILACIYANEFELKFHWSLFLLVPLTIRQLCFTLWLGAQKVPNYHPIQIWPNFRTLSDVYASLGFNMSTL